MKYGNNIFYKTIKKKQTLQDIPFNFFQSLNARFWGSRHCLCNFCTNFFFQFTNKFLSSWCSYKWFYHNKRYKVWSFHNKKIIKCDATIIKRCEKKSHYIATWIAGYLPNKNSIKIKFNFKLEYICQNNESSKVKTIYCTNTQVRVLHNIINLIPIQCAIYFSPQTVRELMVYLKIIHHLVKLFLLLNRYTSIHHYYS